MNILFIILAFVISASVARLIIPRILLISLRKKLFDMPSERKVHKRAIPRLGGVSFFPTILLSSCGVFALRILMGYDVPALRAVYLLPECLFLVCGMTLLYLTGIADDLVGVRYRQKFVIQIICASFSWPAFGSITSTVFSACMPFLPYRYAFYGSSGCLCHQCHQSD